MSTVLLSASMNALSGTMKGVVQREAAQAAAADDGRILVCGTCRMLVGTPHAGERDDCVPEQDRVSVLGMDLLVLPGASNLVEAMTPNDLHPLQRRVVAAMIRRDRAERFADEDLGIG